MNRASSRPPTYNDWKEQSKSFDQMAAYRTGSVNLTGEGKPERVPGVYVSASLFTILDIRPLDGRVFTAIESRDGSNRLVIISVGFRSSGAETTSRFHRDEPSNFSLHLKQ